MYSIMANTKSAKKRIISSARKNKVNRMWKDLIKVNTKNLINNLKGTDKEKIEKDFLVLQSSLDKASQRKIISKNKAAKVKSRMSKSILLNKKP